MSQHHSSTPLSSSALLNRQLFPFDNPEPLDLNEKIASSNSLSILDECVVPIVRLLVRQPLIVSRVLLLSQYNPRRLSQSSLEQKRRARQQSFEREEASQQERLKEAESYLLYSMPQSMSSQSSDRMGLVSMNDDVKTDSLGYITSIQAHEHADNDSDNDIDIDLSMAANPLSRLFYLGSGPGGRNLRLLWRGLWMSSVYQLSRSFLLSQLTMLILERDQTSLFAPEETGSMHLDFASILRLSFCHIAVHCALSPFDRAMTRQVIYSHPFSSSSSLSSTFDLDFNWHRDLKLSLVYHSLYPLCRYLPFAVFEPTVLLKWSFHCLYYLVSMPIETLLVRSHAQEKTVDPNHDAQRRKSVVRLRKLHYPNSIVASLSTIVHEEGVTSLYRGLGWRLFSLSVHLLFEWIRDLEFDDEE